MNVEVEMKFPISRPEAVEQRLLALGAKPAAPMVQIDHYFNHPDRDFGQTDEALRIRQAGDNNYLTYKGPKLDAATKTRREIELPLAPGSAGAAQLAELLGALGFRSVAQVRKSRRKFDLDWNGFRVEAALDDVDEVGSFLELEIAGDDSSMDSAKASIASLAEELELKASERRSYLELLLSS